MEAKWVVVIKLGVDERVYHSNEETRYKAAITSIRDFIKDFKLPGRPYEYWAANLKGGILEISVVTTKDGRRKKDEAQSS